MTEQRTRGTTFYTDGFTRVRYSSEESARRARIIMLEHQTEIVPIGGHVDQDFCRLCDAVRQRRVLQRMLGIQYQDDREPLDLIPRDWKRFYSPNFGYLPSELDRLTLGGVAPLPDIPTRRQPFMRA